MKTLKRFSTKIIDDVFTDEISFFKPKFEVDYDAYVERLWEANPELNKILKNAADLEAARDAVFLRALSGLSMNTAPA